jgi:hypothetical protein
MEQFANAAATTLFGAITSGATSLVVTSATGFPTVGNFRILIDAEILLVTSVSGTTFTVTRGQESTTPTAHNNAVPVTQILTAGGLAQTINDNVGFPTEPGLRLSLTTATPVTTADVTGATTLYYTPYTSGSINLFNGTLWTPYTTGEVSLALGTLLNNTNYDVFATIVGGVVTLTTLAWSGSTTRATALVRQNGAYVLTGTTSWLYIGTFRTTSTTTTEDSFLNRYVWNHYNRVPRILRVTESTANWTYAVQTYRSANNNAANAFNYVAGDVTRLFAHTAVLITQSAGGAAVTGIGIDSTTVNSATTFGGTGVSTSSQASAVYNDYPAVGSHTINWIEEASSGVTATFSANNFFSGAGMHGEILG